MGRSCQSGRPRAPLHLTSEVNVLVYYEDTDFSGYVYHANYLKFFERGREHLLGVDLLKRLYREGIHFVVRKLQVDFQAPARHGDQLRIISSCTLSASPRVLFKQAVECGTPARRLVEADIEVVCVNGQGAPMRIPVDVLSRLT